MYQTGFYLSFYILFLVPTTAFAQPRFFVIGGYNGTGPIDNVDAFDLETRTWQKAQNLPEPRDQLAAATVDRAIYAVGGVYVFGTVHPALTFVYDEMSNWSTSTAAALEYRREGFGLAVLGGKIYAIGGSAIDPRVGWVTPQRSAESFDVAANEWTPIANLKVVRYRPAAATLGRLVYAIGGRAEGYGHPMRSVETYDPQTNVWSSRAPMSIGRFEHCAAVLDGKIYAIGGRTRNVTDSGLAVTPSVEVYDPKFNKWSRIADMSAKRHLCGAVSFGGFVFVVGGRDGKQDPLDTVEVYYPKNDTWITLSARLSPPRWGHAVSLLDTCDASGFSESSSLLLFAVALLVFCQGA